MSADARRCRKGFTIRADLRSSAAVPHSVLQVGISECRIGKVYFTGMLTRGQTDFFIQYIDPKSHTVRSYYPDFMCQKEDGSWMIIEVKRDDQIETPVVQAKKEFASQIAAASQMVYRIIKGTDAAAGHYSRLFQ